jgi:asparagine synthase (glutamine-hydrolysing)
MCGIAGALALTPEPLDETRFKPMVDAIAHRGPDDAGYFVWHTGRFEERKAAYGQAFTDTTFHHLCPLFPPIDSDFGREKLGQDRWDLFLGHRRLAILDLSPRGHQPMSDRRHTIWVVYNGEIYDFRELRSELESCGHRFVSATDTEVIIHAYEEWGISCITRFNGMFAFALWDSRRLLLHLVRDRYGIKPLYLFRDGRVFLFGSEIKSILAYLPSRPGVDLFAMNEYFSFQNVLSDRTLFQGVSLLKPGHYVTLDVASGTFVETQYWDFDFSRADERPEVELEEELYHLINEAVTRQCVSDVPIGSYLSGGMDSGSVTAITRSVLGRIFTFTGGFDLSEAAEHEMTFDEREHAERLANILQTEHYECVMHSGDMEAVMESLIWHLEDLRVGQCYPNYYVARLASKFVKVVMSGAGGDELFGGYPWRYAAALGADHADYVENYYLYWQRLVSNRDKTAFFNRETLDRLGSLDENSAASLRNHTLSVFQNVFGDRLEVKNLADQVNYSLYFECKTFLHGLLVVEDKLSMAHSLETRVPFLDNALVDFACTIPVHCKVANLDRLEKIDENFPRKKTFYQSQINSGKNILRKAMERILPRDTTSAKKQGFSAPDESWFRGRSEQYVRDTLLRADARINEFVNPDYLCEVMDVHSSGRANKRLLIWSLLSLEHWLKAFFE